MARSKAWKSPKNTWAELSPEERRRRNRDGSQKRRKSSTPKPYREKDYPIGSRRSVWDRSNGHTQ